jgi:uncharacterized protein
VARIALDIDSTLHHYWDLFSRVVRERLGIDLPYEHQRTWGIDGVPREELAACVAETHREEHVLAGVPYPGAVEAVREWHERGRWIHVTSHRATASRAATERWLEAIGMPYDDLHCSYDKIARCVERGIDLLVDDSPVNIERARAEGIACATIVHPWNEHLAGRDGVVAARDWRELREAVEPLLAAAR